MEMNECYDCKGKVPEIVLVSIDGKQICPECEKRKGKVSINVEKKKDGL